MVSLSGFCPLMTYLFCQLFLKDDTQNTWLHSLCVCACICLYKYISLVPGKTCLDLRDIEFALLIRKLGNLGGSFPDTIVLVILMTIKITMLIPCWLKHYQIIQLMFQLGTNNRKYYCNYKQYKNFIIFNTAASSVNFNVENSVFIVLFLSGI